MDTGVETCHGEDADEQADVPPGKHDVLTVGRGALGLAGSPDPHEQDQQVEDDDRKDTENVNRHLGWTAGELDGRFFLQ